MNYIKYNYRKFYMLLARFKRSIIFWRLSMKKYFKCHFKLNNGFNSLGLVERMAVILVILMDAYEYRFMIIIF